METFHKMNSDDPKDVFDPSRHHLVAVDKVSKTHFHVTLDEIARDARDALHVTIAPRQIEVQPLSDGSELAELQEEVRRLWQALMDQERAMQAVLQALDDKTTLIIEDGSGDLRLPINQVVQKILSTTVIVPRES